MIKILTDSTSDIDRKFAADNDVAIVPLNVNFDGDIYLDGEDLTAKEFFVKLANSDKLPTTSQPTPQQFMPYFETAKQNGDSVVCILLSSALSGTVQSAELAKAEVDYDGIYIIDSKNATMAQVLLVYRALDLVKAGKSAQEIADDLTVAREHLHLFAIIDDLTYLRKGGRLSTVAAFAGGLLGIKPVVGINAQPIEEKVENHDGTLSLASKARGLPGAYVNVFKLIGQVGGINENLPVVVGGSGDKKSYEPFIRYVTQNLKLAKPTVGEIGAVIGTHAGPGAAGIGFFDNEFKPE